MIHRLYMRTFEDTCKYEMRPESDADPYTYTLGLSNPDSLHILYSLPDQIRSHVTHPEKTIGHPTYVGSLESGIRTHLKRDL